MHICQSSDINQKLNACLKKQFHWLLTVLYRTGMPLDGNLCKIFKLSLNYINWMWKLLFAWSGQKVSDYSKYKTVKIFHQWLRIFFCTGFLIIVYFKKKILNKSCIAWRFDGIFFTQIHPILSCKYALWIEHLYKLNQSIMALFYSDLWLTKLIKLGCQMLWQFILIKVHRKSLL